VSRATLRNIRPGEQETLLGILQQAFGVFHDAPGAKAVLFSERFDPAGCFVAVENGSAVGCVAVTKLHRERWFVIRYLALENVAAGTGMAEQLLNMAVGYADSKHAEYVRATTPAIQPYVDIYKGRGFKPVRRDFRLSRDLTQQETRRGELETRELGDDMVETAAASYVDASRPYWNWRIEEQGGYEAAARSFKEGVSRGEKWIIGWRNGRIVGLAGVLPDYYATEEARFRGVFVLPESRGRGIGSSLMSEAINFAKRLGQRRMTVYTFSYLDCLAPGALLYLRSGGKIEAEHLQLQLT